MRTGFFLSIVFSAYACLICLLAGLLVDAASTSGPAAHFLKVPK